MQVQGRGSRAPSALGGSCFTISDPATHTPATTTHKENMKEAISAGMLKVAFSSAINSDNCLTKATEKSKYYNYTTQTRVTSTKSK